METLQKIIGIMVLSVCAMSPMWSQSNKEAGEAKKKACEIFDPTVYEDPSRSQLRSELLRHLGSLNGKHLIDIGAGAGYFAFEYAKNAKKVTATEMDDRLIKYMNEKKTKLNKSNVSVVKANGDNSEFLRNSYDLALMVDVYHELEDPKIILPILRENMSSNGRIVIVESHISSTIVTDYLKMTGFVNPRTTRFTHENSCGTVEVNIITADSSNKLSKK